jgi:SAM-dependent methyltransferase
MQASIIDQYSQDAPNKFSRYEAMDPEQVHAEVRSFVEQGHGLALDIGAGSGRDANWLNTLGYEVYAIEPSDLRRLGQIKHPKIQWLDDQLPNLKNTFDLNKTFDLIWLSAVWMHIPPEQRHQAFNNLNKLLSPNSMIMISYRNGGSPDVPMYPVSDVGLQQLAQQNALKQVLHEQQGDLQNRDGVEWHCFLFQKPLTSSPT